MYVDDMTETSATAHILSLSTSTRITCYLPLCQWYHICPSVHTWIRYHTQLLLIWAVDPINGQYLQYSVKPPVSTKPFGRARRSIGLVEFQEWCAVKESTQALGAVPRKQERSSHEAVSQMPPRRWAAAIGFLSLVEKRWEVGLLISSWPAWLFCLPATCLHWDLLSPGADIVWRNYVIFNKTTSNLVVACC